MRCPTPTPPLPTRESMCLPIGRKLTLSLEAKTRMISQKVVRPKLFHPNPKNTTLTHLGLSPTLKTSCNKLYTTVFDYQPPANQHSFVIIARARSTHGRDKTIVQRDSNAGSVARQNQFNAPLARCKLNVGGIETSCRPQIASGV